MGRFRMGAPGRNRRFVLKMIFKKVLELQTLELKLTVYSIFKIQQTQSSTSLLL
jgi:hypothetical protein